MPPTGFVKSCRPSIFVNLPPSSDPPLYFLFIFDFFDRFFNRLFDLFNRFFDFDFDLFNRFVILPPKPRKLNIPPFSSSASASSFSCGAPCGAGGGG